MNNDLVRLSNNELIAELEKLVAQEKQTTNEIVRHLAEIEERKLYLDLGYSSMFDYATQRLGYSASSAMRRIRVARAGTKVPEIFNYLAEEKVSLSALSACSDVLVKQDGRQVLERLKGKTREEAEWISASYKPVTPQSVKDKIKKVVIGSFTTQADMFDSELSPSTDEQLPAESFYNRSGCAPEEKFKISFSAGSEFMKKLERVQEPLGLVFF